MSKKKKSKSDGKKSTSNGPSAPGSVDSGPTRQQDDRRPTLERRRDELQAQTRAVEAAQLGHVSQ